MPQVFTLYRGMSVLRRGSREIGERKFLLSNHLIFKWLESRSVIWACLYTLWFQGKKSLSIQKIFPIAIITKFLNLSQIIHSIIRNRKIEMHIAWERIQCAWLFIKLYQSRWRSYCVFNRSWVVKKKKKCDYQQKGCITDKEGKDFTILLRTTLFIIISKWENGKRSIHMLKDYLDLQLIGDYPSKLFPPPFSPLSTFYLTPNVSPKVFFNWKAMAW